MAPARPRPFAEAVEIPVLASIPADEDLRRKSANYQIVGSSMETAMGPAFCRAWPENVAEAPPIRTHSALDQDGLLGLFSMPPSTGGGCGAGAGHRCRTCVARHVVEPKAIAGGDL